MTTQYHSSEFSPLEIKPEENPSASPLLDLESATWVKRNPISCTKCGRSTWGCSHVQRNTRSWSKRALFFRTVQRPFWGLVVILGLVYLFPDDLKSGFGAMILPDGLLSFLSHRPTHDMIPIACHSRQEYWGRVPLHVTLAAGCTGIESNVWLSENELLVGYTPETLVRGQNLRTLYLDPLLRMLRENNTRSLNLPSDGTIDEDDAAGVFPNEPSQSLVLLINFNSDGERLWPRLIEHLEPLREGGYLTFFNGSSVIQRPITVVASGKAPFHRVLKQTFRRDIFFDAPIDSLPSRSVNNSTDELSYSPYNSYYASADFCKAIGTVKPIGFSQSQLCKLRHQIRAAHEHGLKVRYWNTPSWPRELANHVRHVLVREGVDVISG
ncbi:hypothetical protein N7467_011385 [Penicillium canescens]|nr:hypothetical protein N7467_011385 [Penicillium canescens]